MESFIACKADQFSWAGLRLWRHPPSWLSRKADDWLKTPESPNPTADQKVDDVIARLQLKPGTVVAEIGAGTGLFAKPLAKTVAPEGVVYAVDIQQDLLDYINQRDQQENIRNVRTDSGEFNDPRIPEKDVDLALINLSFTISKIVLRIWRRWEGT